MRGAAQYIVTCLSLHFCRRVTGVMPPWTPSFWDWLKAAALGLLISTVITAAFAAFLWLRDRPPGLVCPDQKFSAKLNRPSTVTFQSIISPGSAMSKTKGNDRFEGLLCVKC